MGLKKDTSVLDEMLSRPEIREIYDSMRKQQKDIFERICLAAPHSYGIAMEIARIARVSYKTVHNYYDNIPGLKELVQTYSEELLDEAEKTLVYLIKEEKDFRACRFVLLTKGKHRGYVLDIPKQYDIPPNIEINFQSLMEQEKKDQEKEKKETTARGMGKRGGKKTTGKAVKKTVKK